MPATFPITYRGKKYQKSTEKAEIDETFSPNLAQTIKHIEKGDNLKFTQFQCRARNDADVVHVEEVENNGGMERSLLHANGNRIRTPAHAFQNKL